MLRGKRALVMGVANARSIGWNIAHRWRQEGAEVFVTYQDERFRKKVETLVRDTWGPFQTSSQGEALPCCACDATKDEELEALFALLDKRRFCSRAARPSGSSGISDSSSSSNISSSKSSLGGDAGPPGPPKLDAVLHSIAFAPSDAMKGGSLIDTTREAFVSAHAISAYSLLAVARHARPYLSSSSSIQTLSYIGSSRTVPNYNIMGPAKASLESCAKGLAYELGEEGVRVNVLSPGPVKTLAARGIKHFTAMEQSARERAPLRRSADMLEISSMATFLASPLSTAVTGQVIYVDGGFSSMA